VKHHPRALDRATGLPYRHSMVFPINTIAEDILATFGTARVLDRPTVRYPGFDLESAYQVAHWMRDLRVARGESVIGRKIGGTNPSTYHLTGATGPQWNFMYDTTSSALPDATGSFAMGAFPQARIEPEIALRMVSAPEPGMDAETLIGCVGAICHGFEFVFSPYGDWTVAPPDSVSAFGMHMGFLAGPWHAVGPDRDVWLDQLRTVSITLSGNNETRTGRGSDALGSPILALKAVVDDIGKHPGWTPIAAGEIVTTGTITQLMPAVAGQTWRTAVVGAPLNGLTVVLR
jgi:2-oxo-3-hexenedioate decarboxylase